jgi:hypothetical protein
MGTMIRGEGSAFIVGVTKLADLPDGMIAREDGKFLGRLPGSVITRYRVRDEVSEIRRLMAAGERGRGIAAHSP